MTQIITYLFETNWLLFSFIMIIALVIGAVLIRQAFAYPKRSLAQDTLLVIGFSICALAILTFIDRYTESFRIVLKWAGIGILALFVLSALMFSVLCFNEKDVNAKKRSRCKYPIAVIIGQPKHMEKIFKVGQNLALSKHIVLYPDSILSPSGLQDEEIIFDEVLKDKIRLATQVVFVARHANMDESMKRLESYAKELKKNIAYDIGDGTDFTDDTIRDVLNLPPNTARLALANMDLSVDAIDTIQHLISCIRQYSTVDELMQFASGQLSSDVLREKYKF